MARKAGQIIARGQSTWLVRVYLGRDPQTGTRKYHNQTIHGPFRAAQRFLNLKLQQRDNGRVSCPAVLSLNQLLDQWLATVVRARVRTRTFKDYEALLNLYIRTALGSRLIGTISQIDIQNLYAQMFERGLSARTIEYTNAVLRSRFRPGGLLEDAGRASLCWCQTPADEARPDRCNTLDLIFSDSHIGRRRLLRSCGAPNHAES